MQQFFPTVGVSATDDGTYTPEQATQLLRTGQAPAGMRVRGHLQFAPAKARITFPPGLTVTHLTLDNCDPLPDLPPGLQCYEFELRNTPIKALPDDIRITFRLDLTGCTQLIRLPTGLKVGSLILSSCTALRALPEGLDVYFLDISGCTRLDDWPHQASVRIGGLNAQGCVQLRSLPPWLTEISRLDVRGCISLGALPEGLRITSWIDLADTRIQTLPEASQGVQIRWRGVPINERVAFQPETITATEVLQEGNAEVRRILLERMGYERFLSQARAKVVDADTDPGGERRLLQVPLPNDEDLVCLAVYCPSTGRQYMLRVPPTMRTCHQAAAWIAGFDNPNDYKPLKET